MQALKGVSSLQIHAVNMQTIITSNVKINITEDVSSHHQRATNKIKLLA